MSPATKGVVRTCQSLKRQQYYIKYTQTIFFNCPWFVVICFVQGVNPDVRYEVQYSSYVNVTADGFVILKRVVKTESFALQVTPVITKIIC